MKNIANYTLDEFKDLFKEIPYDIVEVVYGYYYRDKVYTVGAFANKHHISTATLYRYIAKVKNVYERHQ